jgi:hypothetical protein
MAPKKPTAPLCCVNLPSLRSGPSGPLGSILNPFWTMRPNQNGKKGTRENWRPTAYGPRVGHRVEVRLPLPAFAPDATGDNADMGP